MNSGTGVSSYNGLESSACPLPASDHFQLCRPYAKQPDSRVALRIKGGKRISSYVLGFQDIDKTKIMLVGGKGANLGEVFKAARLDPGERELLVS